MPKGIYSRKKTDGLKKAVRKLTAPKKHKMTLTVISEIDGVHIDKYIVHSFFKALELIIENYEMKGILIHEVRVS